MVRWVYVVGRRQALTLFHLGPRYECKQEDGMHGYGWDEYDIRTGGKQVMRDVGNKVDIETSFVKVEGGEHGKR